MQIFIVQGEHWSVSGRPMAAHGIEESANMAAAALVSLLLADAAKLVEEGPAPPAGPATADDWADKLLALKDWVDARDTYFDSEDFDVWITTLEVQDVAPPTPAQTLTDFRANEGVSPMTPTTQPLTSYFVVIEYQTEGGDIAEWRGDVEAEDITAAHEVARRRLMKDKRRRVGKIYAGTATPSVRQPIPSLPVGR